MVAVVVDFTNPLFGAAFIGWTLSVVLHEFAHGLVAYLGGDYTIRERGGLSLNPLQYIDPVVSLILPLVFLLMGGVPLPGGMTYVRRDLLRNRLWSSAVSAAGPAMNFLLFVLLSLSLNPHLGWVERYQSVLDWSPAQRCMAALAYLQFYSVLLNLIPIPPLDGFQIISPYLPREMQERMSRGPVVIVLLIGLFFVISSEPFHRLLGIVMPPVVESMGVDYSQLAASFNLVFFNRPY
jgi:Zn-dependent protease